MNSTLPTEMIMIQSNGMTYVFIVLECSFVGSIEIQIIHNIFSCRQIHYIYWQQSSIAMAVAREHRLILLTFFNVITLNELWQFRRWQSPGEITRAHSSRFCFVLMSRFCYFVRCSGTCRTKFHMICAMLANCTWNECLSLIAIMTSTYEAIIKIINKINTLKLLFLSRTMDSDPDV